MKKKRNLLNSTIHVQTVRVHRDQNISIFNSNQSYFLGGTDAFNARPTHYDLTTQTSVNQLIERSQTLESLNKEAQKFTYGASLVYYKKLKFIGKGYKIRKSRLKKSYKMYFGRSHLQYAFGGGLWLKKLSKYRLIFLSNDKKKLNRAVAQLLLARPINRYTKRGLRAMRQFILKRPGKKSTY